MNKLRFSSFVCVFDLVIPVFAENENELAKLIKLDAATTERIRSFISALGLLFGTYDTYDMYTTV